ncbi:MAG: glycosyl hydrolase 53 family protein [Sphingobacteriales bacterium]|nr:glycosyl hydrolase 53 family protein [Sphingobacteriales bacterium]
MYRLYRIPLIFAFFFFSTVTFAQSRKHILLDRDWTFHLGNASDPAKDFNYGIANLFSKSGKAEGTAIDPKFKDVDWQKIDLPHDWAVTLPFVNSPNFDVMSHGYKPVGALFPETSIGWYRKRFSVNKADSGQRFQIQFDGIYRDAMIWINGFYVGNNKSGYVGNAYDVTDYINDHQPNVLVVRVDATQYEGWFYEGSGIYRHVWLNEYQNTHLVKDGVFVHAAVNPQQATITVEAEVENQNLSATQCSVISYLKDRNGKILGQSKEEPLRLNVNQVQKVVATISLKNPRLWSLDDPYLYKVETVVKANGKEIDREENRLGIRTLRFDANEGFFLNGKHIKIQGTNNHQDHAGVGSALPDYLQYYRIRLLKDMGANAYRTSHNAPTPELLAACDSLGMLVLDEQRLLNSNPEYIDQFTRLIRRDRNHPSVFLWSIGNEEGYIQGNSIGKRLAQTLIAKQKELDPTRACTYAADMANVYQGINQVIPVRGFNYRQFAVADYHQDHPNQPIIGTEMGSTVTTRGIYEKDTVNAYVPDQDITAPWWASKAETWWKLAAVNPYWIGGFVWTGFDYRGEPTPYQWPNINSHFGMMDVCGFPKNIYYYYQSWWTDKDVLHISPHWNWPGKEGQPIEVWVNSNADNVELFLNGKSLGKKEMPRNSHLNWRVNYEPGTLSAIAYKKGRKLEAKVETTGAPVEVVVTPYKTTMLADGKDVSILNISAIDKEGREVPTANNLITFKVSGDAKIIGVGNGDPSAHEPDQFKDGEVWQRHLFNGKAQVILQAGTLIDKIKFEASSEGLYPGSTDIFSIQPGKPHQVTKKVKSEAAILHPAKALGADISFLPQLEDQGVHFSDKGVQKDAIEILKDHGVNYVRLRIFHHPENPKGYAPGKGYCDLAHTLAMAKRVKAAGMKFLLDFHYSDYWADPGKQFKPQAWEALSFPLLTDSLRNYTAYVMRRLKKAGVAPDMVQVGNEINHGMVWPEGEIGHLDSLAQLLQAGIDGVKEVNPKTPIMLHVALGGQQDEANFFYDNMIERGVQFDVIGLSYYPKWHGTLDDLRDNLINMSHKYPQDLVVVEYSAHKKEVNDIVFNLPNGKGKGTFIWEPLNTWSQVIDQDGKANEKIKVYDALAKEYLK